MLIGIYLLGILFPDYCRNCNDYHSEKMGETDTLVITYSDGREERREVARNCSCICALISCIAVLGQLIIWP